MARQTNGTSDYLNSASALTMGSATKLSVSLWLYWDAFANDWDVALETGAFWTEGGLGGWTINPNFNDGSHPFVFAAGNDEASIARPSAAAWHHYAVNFDIGITSNHVVSVYVDGASQTLTNRTTSASTLTFADKTLYFMAREGTSLWGAGRIAEVALWTGTALSGTDASNLNGGTLPTSVQAGNLVYYWKLCGTASPETATVGGVNATVVGATQVAHPAAVSGSCGGGQTVTWVGYIG